MTFLMAGVTLDVAQVLERLVFFATSVALTPVAG